jgi:uncharacterized protein YjbI with pentapeptide repeats
MKTNKDLHGKDLHGADLHGADLHGKDLRGADLRGANLRDADLGSADLRWANLSGADLRGADLHGAGLGSAGLGSADLSDADLSGADLRDADLRDADLHGADLRWANLRRADLRGVLWGFVVPAIDNIDASVLAAISGGGSLNMAKWHACDTTHCRAGWAIHLAGAAGYALEKRTTPYLAGRLIYEASRPDRDAPDFFASDEDAMEDLRASALAEA